MSTTIMSTRSQKGFTLIELLVVIAIIGILAAIVIANLQTARAKARRGAATGTISSLRAEAENFYDTNNLSYGTGNMTALNNVATGGAAGSICDAATAGVNTGPMLVAASREAGGATAHCDAIDQSYTIYLDFTTSAAYSTTGLQFFCVDSTGYAGVQAAVPAAVGVTCQ